MTDVIGIVATPINEEKTQFALSCTTCGPLSTCSDDTLPTEAFAHLKTHGIEQVFEVDEEHPWPFTE